MRRAAAATVLLMLSGSRTMGEPCAPSARLDGDGELAARVGAELERLGVASTAAPGCPSLRAAVTRDPSGAIAVTVRDRADRIEGRVVGDAALAAVWIDSWLRDDVAAPLLAPRALPPAVATADAATDAADPRDADPMTPGAPPGAAPPGADVRAAAAPARPGALDRLAVSAGYESGWTDDGGAWSGGTAAMCGRLGRLCAGTRVRMAWQGEAMGANNMTAAARDDLEVLATASASLTLGRMTLTPELGAGVGRLHSRRLEGCKPAPPPTCNPNDPTNPACPASPPPDCNANLAFVGDGFDATTWTPRVAAAVRVAVPLFDHVWLEGSASAEVAPGGHGAFATQPDSAGNVFTLPGEPTAALMLGVGLRVGGP